MKTWQGFAGAGAGGMPIQYGTTSRNCKLQRLPGSSQGRLSSALITWHACFPSWSTSGYSDRKTDALTAGDFVYM